MTGDERIWRPAEILARYRLGERDFRGLDICEPDDGSAELGASFRAATLDGADFSGAFVFADWSDASLVGCKFVAANVKTCSFDRADLRHADFSDAAIDAATFDAANLDGAIFVGAGAFGYTLKPGELPV